MEDGRTSFGLQLAPEAVISSSSVVPAPVLLAPSPLYRFVKRAVDVSLSLIALAVTMPVWLVAALLVRCTSSGPVLFRQARVGRGGREFTVLKFRSMFRDAESQLHDRGMYATYVAGGFKLAVAQESRVTRIGKILRKTSLDELPQLLNVIRGEMSLVGPRPVVPSELDCYGDLKHCYLGVRPGITGVWQVSGRSQVRFPERAHLDKLYFQQRSLLVDLAILVRTPWAVLRGRGAY